MHIISNIVRVQIGIASPLCEGLVAYPFASNVFKSTKRILKKSRRSFYSLISPREVSFDASGAETIAGVSRFR